MIFISEKDVRDLVNPQQLLQALSRVMVDLSDGGDVIQQPLRSAVKMLSPDAWFLSMPALVSSSNCLSTKLIRLVPGAEQSHLADIVLFDPDTGATLAWVEATYLTEIRTAAATMVAIKGVFFLFTPRPLPFIQALAPQPVRTITIIGAGKQAESHSWMLKHAGIKFDTLRICSRTGASACSLVERLGFGTVVEDLEQSVTDADIVITCTFSKTPVLRKSWLMSNALICCIGACRPDWLEVGVPIMTEADVFVDTKEGAWRESGDVIASGCRIQEIGKVLSGAVGVDRQNIVVYKSLGMACQDCVAAKLIYDSYLKRGENASTQNGFADVNINSANET